MKLKGLCLCLAAVMVLSSCGQKKAQKPDAEVDNTVKAQDSTQYEEPVEIISDEAEIAANRNLVGSMLSCFKNLDYEGAMEYIRESDRELFDLESTNQRPLYDNLFAKLSYEFADSFIQGGRRYVETIITAPDMLDIYGEINLRYIDALLNGEISGEDEAREFNNLALAEIVSQDDVKMKTMSVNVELQTSDDGTDRVVFTAELMNAMLGDVQTAGQQVSDAIEEGMDEYNSAKESGALD